MLTGTAGTDDTSAPAPGLIVTQRSRGNAGHPTGETGGTGGSATGKRPGRRADLLALGSYLLGALWVVLPLLAHYGKRMPISPGDRAQAEYFLAYDARIVSHGAHPFLIDVYNAPFGVNGMANTSMLGFGIPLSPITLLFGAQATFDLLIVLGIAGTAAAWYLLLSRRVVSSRTAAWVAGLIAGFTPSVTSHASYHPNLVAQFMVPLLAWAALRLLEPGRSVRKGLLLAGLVVYQVFINEETLFLVALGLGVYLILFALQRRDRVRQAIRPLATGLAVTAVAALAVLAYPLWVQFTGPGSYHGGEQYMTTFRMDVLGLTSYGSNSVAERLREFGPPGVPLGAEEHGFYGWGLFLAVVALVVWQWRDLRVRCLALVGALFAVLAMGDPLKYQGQDTRIPGPFRLIEHLPLFDTLLPTRLGEVTTWAMAPIVALGLQRLADRLRERPELTARTRRLLLAGALAALVLPALPTPVIVESRPPVPSFISSGQWRSYVGPGQTIMVVPFPQWEFQAGIFWAASTDAAMPMSHGYFLGPADGIKGHHASVGPVHTPTDTLLSKAMYSHTAQPVTAADRTQAIVDLHHYRTALILAPNDQPSAGVRDTVTALYGPGQLTGGVWMWDVRPL